jgi:hypothetical protein
LTTVATKNSAYSAAITCSSPTTTWLTSDWHEVAERSALDERRGLVITRVAVIEDVVDEFILYLADPSDHDAYQADLDRLTIGPRLDRLEDRGSHRGVARKSCENTIRNQECPPRSRRTRSGGSPGIIIGVDPHKGSHTAVAIGDDEARLAR